MTQPTPAPGSSWSARLLIALVLILAGAGRGDLGPGALRPAARFLGVAPSASRVARCSRLPRTAPAPTASGAAPDRRPTEARDRRRSKRGWRGSRMRPQRAEGSAGRADALLVAFAARRAIDRGVALGYLETLLVDRFGSRHPRAVATIVTGVARAGPAQRADRRL